MYTTRVARPRELRPRHSVENQWDLLDAARHRAARSRRRIPVEMAARSARGRARSTSGSRAPASTPTTIASSSSTSAPAIRSGAGRSTSFAAARRRARRAATPAAASSSRPGRRSATRPARVIDEARARSSAPAERARVLDVRRVLARRAARARSTARRSTSAATAARCTSPRRARVPIVGLYGPTLPARSAPWRAPTWPTEAVEVGGLPCRPCDQRVVRARRLPLPDVARARAGASTAAERALARAAGTSIRAMTAEPERPAGQLRCRHDRRRPPLDARAPRTPIGSNRPALLALFGVAGALQFSIAVAQILLTVALCCWLALVVARRERIEVPRVLLAARSPTPALTLVSAAFSPRSAHEPRSTASSSCCSCSCRSSTASPAARAPQTLVTVDRVAARAVSAAVGIVQYGILHYDNLGQRPQGTLGHYMTYSGLLMLVIGVALARAAVRHARSHVGGARHAGARRRRRADLHAQRRGRRLRGVGAAVRAEGLPAARGRCRSSAALVLRARAGADHRALRRRCST